MQVSSHKVCLHKKGAHTLERSTEGVWSLDGIAIEEEQAVAHLIDAVSDLGYWCQVAKDVLDKESFETVQEAYEYRDPDADYGE